MILSVIAMLQAVAAPAPQAASVPEDKTIVVVGRRLSDTERALAACIARKCPPREDIDASLAHAENQFLTGDYAESRRTLLAARRRNAKYAKDLPVDVSDLLRANARLAGLNGAATAARINTIDTLDALKSGLPADDPRVLMQRLSVGDAFAKQARFEAAEDIYNRVARQARAAGLPQVEGHALLRNAVLFTAIAGVNPAFRDRARKAIARVQATTDPAQAGFRDAAVTLSSRAASGVSDEKAQAAARADMATVAPAARATTAVLIHAPPIDLGERGASAQTVMAMQGDDAPQWVDVAFWVAPDGSVRDIDIVRQSANAGGGWIGKVKESLAGRVYRPLALAASDPGLRRIERYSLVYDVLAVLGSRIPSRESVPHIEITDLTVDTAAG
ncbi:hypothetical protein ASE75_11405 [Sphingomonas sp. Leaf17]|uniref:hypothetical protein n=1 Tax=Sphingomonas sp. Leaf17 TaxID=1735683 RepID=UPI0006F34859|nr:hypothetical protein [Sphingomonas sp. Leaf17]KQM63698.1 hypothetical protein ASE75_11405 [Sphingomonas sp. Leaf17]